MQYAQQSSFPPLRAGLVVLLHLLMFVSPQLFSHHLLMFVSSQLFSRHLLMFVSPQLFSHHLLMFVSPQLFSRHLLMFVSPQLFSHHLLMFVSPQLFSHHLLMFVSPQLFSHHSLIFFISAAVQLGQVREDHRSRVWPDALTRHEHLQVLHFSNNSRVCVLVVTSVKLVSTMMCICQLQGMCACSNLCGVS